jgi:hypothetical protein
VSVADCVNAPEYAGVCEWLSVSPECLCVNWTGVFVLHV